MADRMTQGAEAPATDENDILQIEMRRRDAYRLVFGAGAAALVGMADRSASAAVETGLPQFAHGVASGDPRRDRVVIWTRVTPPRSRRVRVAWQVSTTPDMAAVVASGETFATEDRDFTVKVDVRDLLPGGLYWYQFEAEGVLSPVGRTRTLPERDATDPVSLAVFSCSNYEKGFFNVYGEAAKDAGLFAVIHLGDYTYEYGKGGYITPALATGLVSEPRAGQLRPRTETVLLDAYRKRLAIYRTDPDLQALHAHAPWITIYDDHESANDAWTGGAENHDPATEGSWQDRKLAALQAYYEWMPLRERPNIELLNPATGNPENLPRSFTFGKVARLFAVDTRLAGRDRQLSTEQVLGIYQADAGTGQFTLDRNPDGTPRSMLGAEQEAWLDEGLEESNQVWQVIANQVLFHYQIAADLQGTSLLTEPLRQQVFALLDQLFGPGSGALFAQLGTIGAPSPASEDTWTGYPAAKARLYGSLAKARNPIILAGDSHNAWAANLGVPGPGGAKIPLGVEFGTASVTSPGFEEFFLGIPPALLDALLPESSQAKSPTDTLIYSDTSRRGFIKLTLGEQTATADFVFVSTVFSQSYTTSVRSFTVQAGAKKIAGT